jgi:hypothetical protein
MQGMVVGPDLVMLAVARDPSTTPLRGAVPLPVPGRILSASTGIAHPLEHSPALHLRTTP